MSSESLETKGNGGIRQMHKYVELNYVDKIPTLDDHDYKDSK